MATALAGWSKAGLESTGPVWKDQWMPSWFEHCSGTELGWRAEPKPWGWISSYRNIAGRGVLQVPLSSMPSIPPAL